MLIAIDTETTAWKPRARAGGKTLVDIEPFEVPELVLLSYFETGSLAGGGISPDPHQKMVWALGTDYAELVFHNLAFDYAVLTKAFPDLREPFDRAIEAGRVHDTMLLEMLLGLADGRYDMPRFKGGKWSRDELLSPSLEQLSNKYLGWAPDKDPEVRLGYGEYLGRVDELPHKFRRYAIDDAKATLGVYKKQLELFQPRCATEVGRWGPLSEKLQIQASICFAEMDQRGVDVDTELAQRLYERFSEYLWPLREELVAFDLGRWKPASKATRRRVEGGKALLDVLDAPDWTRDKDGQLVKVKHYKEHSVVFRAPADFSIDTRAIQERLAHVSTSKPPPRREDGTLSLDYDFWAEHAPDDKDLKTWLTHEKLKKILTTYLTTYSSTPRCFARYRTLGARSGRVSAARPNVMNIPKRRLGIRSLFLPPPGMCFVKADYSAQELLTLAEVMSWLRIEGPLLDAIKSGIDLHKYGAALILGKDPSDVTHDERKGQKVLHFGVPGGLGAVSLANYAHKMYGVKWTKNEAAEKKAQFLSAFHDISAYLKLINDAGKAGKVLLEDAWLSYGSDPTLRHPRRLLNFLYEENPGLAYQIDRCTTVELPTGRRRAHCRFTEAANTLFQGLAADVSKRALWLCRQMGLDVRIFVHDEIVCACEPDEVKSIERHLSGAMLMAFKEICPIVGPFAQVEVEGPLERWGKTTDMEGEVIA